MGGFAAMCPLFPGLGSLYFLTFLFSVFGGALDLGANVMLVEVWSGDSGGAPAMNMLHFSWGVGSLLSPLVAEGVGLAPSRLTATWAAIGLISLALGIPTFFVPPPSAPRGSGSDDKPDSGDEEDKDGGQNNGSNSAANIQGDRNGLAEQDPAGDAHTGAHSWTSVFFFVLVFCLFFGCLFVFCLFLFVCLRFCVIFVHVRYYFQNGVCECVMPCDMKSKSALINSRGSSTT